MLLQRCTLEVDIPGTTKTRECGRTLVPIHAYDDGDVIFACDVCDGEVVQNAQWNHG